MKRKRTAQEILQFTFEKLLEQGKPSVDPEWPCMCLYREDKTAQCKVRCAIGHLIPNSRYRSRHMEEEMVSQVLSRDPQLMSILPTDMDESDGVEFLTSLQGKVHDDLANRLHTGEITLKEWPEQLMQQYNELASDYKLNPVEIR